jgi:hypothetical protein
MNTRRAFLLVACCAVSSACTTDIVAGSGNVVTEARNVSGFSGVSLNGSGQLFIEQSGSDSLTVTADDNILPEINTEVVGNTLMLGVTDPMTSVRPTRAIVFRMTVKALDDLRVSGSGKVDARALNQDRLSVGISGSGEVLVQGSADSFDLTISGSGGYRGEEMKSRRASVDVSGSGSALVAASDTLSADISGSGMVDYIGDPRVSERVSGSGRVRRH